MATAVIALRFMIFIENSLKDQENFNLRWNSKFFKTSLSYVPPEPGLYAFGRKIFYLELEEKREYVY